MKLRALFLVGFLMGAKLFGAQELASYHEPRHEIGLGVANLLGYGGRTTGGELLADFDGVMSLHLAADYHFAVVSMLQLGINTAFSYLENAAGGSVTALQVLGGPVLNIPLTNQWVHNSFFISAKAGFVYYDPALAAGTTNAMLAADFGYRAKLSSNITWRPSVGAVKLLNGSKFLFSIRFVSFSVVF